MDNKPDISRDVAKAKNLAVFRARVWTAISENFGAFEDYDEAERALRGLADEVKSLNNT